VKEVKQQKPKKLYGGGRFWGGQRARNGQRQRKQKSIPHVCLTPPVGKNAGLGALGVRHDSLNRNREARTLVLNSFTTRLHLMSENVTYNSLSKLNTKQQKERGRGEPVA
jgi:hypothetical protein